MTKVIRRYAVHEEQVFTHITVVEVEGEEDWDDFQFEKRATEVALFVDHGLTIISTEEGDHTNDPYAERVPDSDEPSAS